MKLYLGFKQNCMYNNNFFQKFEIIIVYFTFKRIYIQNNEIKHYKDYVGYLNYKNLHAFHFP